MLLLAMFGTAVQAAPDCDVGEDDYRQIRSALQDLRRSYGAPILVAGSGTTCDRALVDVLRNDPLLAAEHIEIGSVTEGAQCGAILEPAAAGWQLVTVGVCPKAAPITRRIVSFGYWMPQGVSVRWNEDWIAGLSGVVDASVQVDPSLLDEGPSWRLLGGVDISQGPLVTDNYLGFRFGAESVTLSGVLEQDAVTHFVVGRKWVGGVLALQVAGGVMARIPLGEGIQDETLHPVLELRLGVADRR